MQLFRERKLGECIACTEKVLASNPEDALAYSILGAAYAEAGDRGMSIAAFERCLAIEPSARAHFNLGAAYERAARLPEAIEQFQLALQKDQSYQPAQDALGRLSKAGPPVEEPTPPSAEAEHAAGLLARETDEGTGPEPTPEPTQAPPEPAPGEVPPGPAAAAPPPPQGAPAAVTTQVTPPTPAPPPGQPSPTVMGGPGYAPPVAPGQPPVGPRAPDLRSLEMRTRGNEEKAGRAQADMAKAGLIYGIVLGPVGLMGVLFFFRMVGLIMTSLVTTLISGVILGALVGLWIGYTSGDETDGAKVGALLGALALGVPAILHASGLGFGLVALFAFCGAIAGGAAGFFIGMMVERSIGWN